MTEHENQFLSVSADPAMPPITFWVSNGDLNFDLQEHVIRGCAEVLTPNKSAVRCTEKGEMCFSFTLNHRCSLNANGDVFTNEVVEIVSGLIWSRVRRNRLREQEESGAPQVESPENGFIRVSAELSLALAREDICLRENRRLAALEAKAARYEKALRSIATYRDENLFTKHGPLRPTARDFDDVETIALEVLKP
jgi:hypothetical protein